MTTTDPPGYRSLSALRRFARAEPPAERCDFCGNALAEPHEHLFEPARRSLHCCCDSCAFLLGAHEGGRFRRVPRRVEVLRDFRLSDEQWEGLHLPINLAFFSRGGTDGGVLAFYPSPAGATESLLSLEAWRELEGENPVLRELEPDVEALLADRMGRSPAYFRVPIDACYELVGLLRVHWRGLSGGSEVWEHVGHFFERLRARAGETTSGGSSHA